MRDRQLTGWDPVTLLRGLAHPWLPQASGLLAHDLAERTERPLEGGGISGSSRRELTTVNYVLSRTGSTRR
ncbi:hypothetical protein [Streptomyces sp. NPDC001502]|uniref:hypothetical protein n=1 Tax=Streptomyces sp. NPDC001502 TaxID=3364578 RepID=UPI00367F1039